MASTRRRLAWKSGQNEKDVENVEIEHAYRISKEERHGPSQKRTIIANFLNFKDKEKVLREYRSSRLWEERLYINEDFSMQTLETRKKLFKQAKKLRKKEKFTKVMHGGLISYDARQILQQMKNRNLLKSF